MRPSCHPSRPDTPSSKEICDTSRSPCGSVDSGGCTASSASHKVEEQDVYRKADPSKGATWGSSGRAPIERRPRAGYNAGFPPRKRTRMQHVDEISIASASGVQGPHPGKAWPAEILAEAYALFEIGYGYRRTAAQLGLPVPTVQTWQRKWKKDNLRTTNPSPKKPDTSELRAKAIELFEQGYGFKRAAEELGIPASTVCRWKRKWKTGDFHTTDPRPTRCWLDEVRVEAVSLFEVGDDYKKIAAKLDVPVGTVRGWEQQWKDGNFRTTCPPSVRGYSEEVKNRACELRTAGLSLNAIHRELQVPECTVYRWLLKKGLVSKNAPNGSSPRRKPSEEP